MLKIMGIVIDEALALNLKIKPPRGGSTYKIFFVFTSFWYFVYGC